MTMALPDVLTERAPLVDVARARFSPSARRGARLALMAATAVLAAVGAVLLFVSRGELWLDEAQTVAIAKLPLGDLFTALREDGSPPLYYLLQHVWIQVFGESTGSVRTLSGLFALACLPAMWLLATRLAGRRVAWSATVLLATSPFAIRYGTEARMYSLVVLLVLLGALALQRAWTRPTTGRLVAVALASGALLTAHYWALYLVAAVVLVSLLEVRRGHIAVRVPVAVALGGLLFVPWVPAFAHQVRSTGAPWAGRASLGDLVDVLHGYGAPERLDSAGWTLWLALLGLTILGVFGRRRRSGAIELRWRGRGVERALGAVTGLTLALALGAGIVGDSPVTARYTAVVFPLVVLLAAIGLSRLSVAGASVVLAVAAATGLMGGWDASLAPRTAAPRVAAQIERLATPDDLVVYCPDQLGPSTSRLLETPAPQITFPSYSAPQRVDWDDYLERFRGTDVDAFAAEVDAMATGDIWLVTAPNYMTTSEGCRQMRESLAELRPRVTEIVPADGRFFEQAQLFRLRPAVTTS
jgi:hypothetical protein